MENDQAKDDCLTGFDLTLKRIKILFDAYKLTDSEIMYKNMMMYVESLFRHGCILKKILDTPPMGMEASQIWHNEFPKPGELARKWIGKENES